MELEVSKPRYGHIEDDNALVDDNLGWVVDVRVVGSITSEFLDTITTEQGGIIDEAFVYVNHSEEPARTVDVVVTKGFNPGSLTSPFPYHGRISMTFTGVAATDGTNVIGIRTADGVYKLEGYSEHAYTVQFPEIPTDPNDPALDELSEEPSDAEYGGSYLSLIHI